MTNPYGDAAAAYLDAGWAGVIPVPYAKKAPVPSGYTGEGGAYPTAAEVEAWSQHRQNIALRYPPNVVALDVDGGAAEFVALTKALGPLPATWRNVGNPDRLGHFLFRLPVVVSYRDLKAPCAGVDLLRHSHRYSVVWPSAHPDGHTYTWMPPQGFGTVRRVPRVAELPELPAAWVEHLRGPGNAPGPGNNESVSWDDFRGPAAGLGEPIVDNHDDALSRYTASLAARGYGREEALVLALARAGDVVGGDPRRPFTERDFDRWWRGAEAKFKPAESEALAPIVDETTGERTWPFEDWRALANGPAEPIEWLVHGLLAARRGHVIYSASGVGKSLLIDEMSLAMVRGGLFLGAQCRKSTVLVIDHENDPHGETWDRLRRMGADPAELDQLKLLSFPEMDPLDTEKGGALVLACALDVGADLVIIDTATRTIGGEENSNDTWGKWDKHTGARLRAAGIAFLRLDHSGKDGSRGARGGSNKISDVHFAWELECVDEDAQEFRLTSRKNRTLLPAKVLTFKREDTPLLRSVLTESDWSTIQIRKETALWEQLDRLGVSPDAGRPTCEGALKRAGATWDTNVLTAVVRARKAQGNAFATRPDWAPDPARGGLVLGQGAPDSWAHGQPRVA